MDETVTAEKQGGRLILHFLQNVTSANAEQVRQRVNTLLSGQEREETEADLSGAEYFSSAGLRLLLGLCRSEKRFRVTGAGPQMYDTLSMTGFTDMMEVSRRARRFSTENAELIGEGFYSRVYRLDDETVVKLFRPGTTDEQIRDELSLNKYAFTRGIPTAISYDLAEADGQKGLVFEMMNCGSLRDALLMHPEQTEELTDKYAALLRDLHAARDTSHRLPSARERALSSLERAAVLLGAADAERARAWLLTLPESDCILHGDCHVKNIMLHNGEPLLIDLESLSRGDPVLELGGLYFAYTAFEELWPGEDEHFFGLSRKTCFSLRDGVLARCLAHLSPEEAQREGERVRLLSALRMLAHLARYRREDERAITLTRKKVLEGLETCGVPARP